MAKNSQNAEILRRVIALIGKRVRLLVLSMLLAVTSVSLILYVPILIGRAVDCITAQGDVQLERIIPILIRVAAVALAAAAVQWLMNLVNNRLSYGVVRDLRDEAFRKVESLPLSYLDSHPSGDVVSRIITDADQFSEGLLMGFSQLFTGVVTILGTLVFMLTINIPITAVVVVLTPLSLFVARFIANRTYALFRKQSEIRGEQTAFIDEMITGQKVVKSFSREGETLARFDEINERLAKCSLSAIFYSSLVNPGTRFINGVVYAAVALAGALTAVTTGGVTAGGLVSLLSYANQYTKPFNEISGVVAELQNALACAGRLFELIEQPPEEPEDENAFILGRARGLVQAEGVCFSYTPEHRLIEDFNLSVEPGQRVAIVGPTGCGKTTIINLLMRFYDVDKGMISVDGHGIERLTRCSLRENYGMVLQDTWLKNGTVRENIKFGKPDATDEEMIAAAKAAHAHGFICRLSNGYDTVIGEDGGLSQGQKQLLCITRVMLCLPPMLILDEATSSIDTRTETRIQKAFARMMRGRTSFIVAHRLSTIREADVILVMKNGSVVETGSHDSLLAKGGFYASLYNSQFEK